MKFNRKFKNYDYIASEWLETKKKTCVQVLELWNVNAMAPGL
jgi:hypothetical protein